MFNPRELVMILAALKQWRVTVLASGADTRSEFPKFMHEAPVSEAEVTALCERLIGKFGDPAEPCDCQSPGEFCSGVPGSHFTSFIFSADAPTCTPTASTP